MLFVSLLTLIVAIPLYTYRITPQTYVRVTIITFAYSALLAFNSFYIESIKSGISIYNGLFQITTISQRIEIFIYFVGILILFGAFSPAVVGYINSPPKEHYTSTQSGAEGFSRESKVRKVNRTGGQSLLKSTVFAAPKLNRSRYNLDTDINRETYNEFSLMIIFTTIGASFLISSSDVVSVYLSIELQSFAVYVLAALYRNSESATAAGLKYFLLGGLSSAIILLGTGIVYRYTGITQIESIFNIVSSSGFSGIFFNTRSNIGVGETTIEYSDNFSVLFGVFLITVGLLFKVAAAPFHNWAPDVYDGVPTVIRSWITTMPKISIFILLLELNSGIESIPNFFESIAGLQNRSPRVSDMKNSFDVQSSQRSGSTDMIFTVFSTRNPTIGVWRQEEIFKNLLLVCSLLSLVVGTVVGLSQYRIKRLLAFSTISHVGFILLALAIYTEESIDSFIFYIFQYSITNANVFLILLAFGYRSSASIHINKGHKVGHKKNVGLLTTESNGDIQFIETLKGQFYSNPLLSLRFAISLFSMAGIPPLIGFFAKQMVLYSSIHNGYYFISFIAILVSVISASYYLKIIQTMYFNTTESSSSSFFSEKTRRERAEQTEINGSGLVSSFTITSRTVGPSNMHSISISIITMFISLFMLYPSIITNSCEILSLSIFNY